ncbi:hypothetical protein RND81_01G213400 [Saponaria officinalis]|uniref:Inhibitor I9 domain-containing protein n=1 Tax=Saponaria officinalis TaxID=3572 RepID=A0AAW1N900_SAPOF
MQNNSSSTLKVFILLAFFTTTTISTSISLNSINMADNAEQSSSSPSSTPPSSGVYIVYTAEPSGGAEPESFHLSTLSSVLGSEEAAKDSLVYVYKNAATGFSAKLTPEQVAQIEQQPGVLQVVESKPLKLHGRGGAKNMKI